MTLTEHQKHLLKKFVKELSQYRGRHTELVTVYIPSGYDMNKIINHLYQEQDTASNIKSTGTRKNVQAALEKMIQHLKVVGHTPENGLATFAGNTAKREGQQDINVWSIEPPTPLKTRIYRCDKEFVLDLLIDMMEVKEVYGLIVMDRREANIAYLKGKTIIPLQSKKSNVPGKTRAGGQSSKRFEHLRDDAAKEFYKKCAEAVKKEFLGNKNLKGILVGGPGPTKHDFINQITTEVKNKIIAVKDLSYTDEFGLQELVDKSQDVLSEEDIVNEKKIMLKFFELLAKNPNKVSYGLEEVKTVLEMGAVDTLLLSEALEDEEMDKLEKLAKKFKTEVMIISTETREGVQLRDLGKVAGILRYEVHQ